jgi:hypothetical protein
MQIEKYSVYEFLFLSEEKRAEMTAIYNLVTFDVDCKTWTFEAVKETQYMMKRQLDYKAMIEIVSRQINTDILSIDAHVFFGTFNGIAKSILDITEIENNALGHTPTGDEMIASEEVGGFDSFGYLPELDRLANGDILKYDAIRKLSWSECFSKLAYDSRQSRYQNKMLELIHKKND